MNKPAAITAQVVDIANDRLHKGFIKITVHVPEERGGLVTAVLGWPTYTKPVDVALARLDTKNMKSVGNEAAPGGDDKSLTADVPSSPPPIKRKWEDMPPDQRAGIRCNDPLFLKFLKECKPGYYPPSTQDEVAVWVRRYCDIASRAELRINAKAAKRWDLLDGAYNAWFEKCGFVEA